MKQNNSIRQILIGAALAAALFAGGVTQQHFFGARTVGAETLPATAAPAVGITDTSVASDEQNNIEIYRRFAPGVVFIRVSAEGGSSSTRIGGRHSSPRRT